MTKSQIPNSKSKLVIGHWSLVISMLLIAWGLRLCCLEAVGPGWRDDELINIHALSGEVLAGRFPLYFTGASGHEPMYHYLHAGVHALLGFNVLSGHLLSVAFGTLTVALTYVLARRMFGRGTAVITSGALTFSFWSLMYSRTAIRHVNLPPFALAAFYVLWRTLGQSQISTFTILGLVVGASLYIYPAARLIPALLVVFAVYLALFHRERFRRYWRGLLLALAVTAIVAVPLGVAITRVTGVDARIAELAVPVRELRAGNPRLLIESVWTTLSMFHATGDPEWLYNIPDRPVFNWLGGALLWAGVALCLYRWRRPRYFFLLAWLGLGLLPAFVSTPPASLSHTILAQPVAYMLPALVLTEAYRAVKLQTPNSKLQISNLKSQISAIGRFPLSVARWAIVAVIVVFLASNAVRDLRDYFVSWPERGMVRFLYRADYRDVSRYLNTHAEVADVAVSSALMGPWDRLAVEVDIRRDGVGVRFFNPERALVWPAGETPAILLLTSSPDPAPSIDAFLEANGDLPAPASRHIELYTVKRGQDLAGRTPLARFANGLDLIGAEWIDEASLAPGQEATLLTTWRVAGPLELPPIPIIANPPPPGIYSGSRVSIFAHLLTPDETSFVVDDGLWLDPLTLQPGDWFLQVHRFPLPPDMPAGPYLLELGGYDPMTGDRWPTLQADGQPGGDRFSRPVGAAPSADLWSEVEGGGS